MIAAHNDGFKGTVVYKLTTMAKLRSAKCGTMVEQRKGEQGHELEGRKGGARRGPEAALGLSEGLRPFTSFRALLA